MIKTDDSMRTVNKIIYSLSPIRKHVEKEINLLSKSFGKNKINVLEIGAGEKSYKTKFPHAHWIVTDVKKGISIDKIADVTNLKYNDNTFDVVFCIAVLEHVYDYKKAISEMLRVLNPTGQLILSVPFAYPIHDAPADYWRFTEYALKRMLSNFESVKIKKLAALWNRTPMGYFVIAKKK